MFRRAVIPPVKGGGTGGLRGAGDDIPTPNTIPGGYPKAGSGTSGSDIPRIGKGDDGPNTYQPPVINDGDALSPPNQYGTGTASSSTSLCARNKSTCDDMKDVAEELVEQIMDTVSDAAGGKSSSGDSDPAATAPTAARNVSTVAPAPTPMPNLNMSSWMDLCDYRALFTEEEYSMLQEDPLCFYANFGRLYEKYASESRAPTGSAPAETSTTATTKAPAKRTAQPRPRDDYDPTPCLGCEVVEDPGAPATATGIHEGRARTLYLTYLPDQLRMVYTSTPTSLTVTATATTSCSGLSGLGIEGFETPYEVFGYRDGYAPAETGSVDSASEVTSGGAPGREGLMPWTGLVMLGVLWLSRLV
ncbi:hypothetical protein INS49_005032 [Diaporthe citri]|uniref:uncharacterized protein n=1 Tax=Diaporthe citri TaxID=83186 RepID=UPI001C7ECB9C|nr:uncharacterized protein INS49_005032 [Diaporthe citri]KAG6354061.1 hypothetical protein INS49_005032 [Diaporthe citri]